MNRAIVSSPLSDRFGKKSSPDLLPYLPDRDLQENEIEAALERLKQHGSPRPIVFMIHGDINQSHDTFIERLQGYILPQILGIDSVDKAIQKCALPWPEGDHEFRQQLGRNLLDKFKSESLEKLNEDLATYSSPVLIHAKCHTNDWHSKKFSILDEFLEFWQDWPKLEVNQILMVCLCISYLEGDGFCERYKHRSLNRKISQQLDNLSKRFSRSHSQVNSKAKQFDRLITTVLPKLDNITLTQAKDWANSQDVKTFLENDRSVLKLKQDIIRFYQEWHNKNASWEIPMSVLGEHLESLLESLLESNF